GGLSLPKSWNPLVLFGGNKTCTGVLPGIATTPSWQDMFPKHIASHAYEGIFINHLRPKETG
ncbi:MAG: hypothetical protein EBT45_08170, partial [Alphaproteobacteria bacterium]|nr:hypothetical protein [Alphaproteobacteria bacterium]